MQKSPSLAFQIKIATKVSRKLLGYPAKIFRNSYFSHLFWTIAFAGWNNEVAPWCHGVSLYGVSLLQNFIQQILNSGSAQVETCSRSVRNSQWLGSLTVVAAVNKVKRLLPVNHTTKTIHHQIKSRWSSGITRSAVCILDLQSIYFRLRASRSQRWIKNPVKQLK